MLSALGEVPDPQIALQLLRHCVSFDKMVYSLRTVPSHFHKESLREFDAAIRACFEQFTCLHPDDEQWRQACLPTHQAGLGLRSAASHGDAAFLASRSSCLDLCREIDPLHCLDFTDGSLPAPERLAFDAYNASVSDDYRLLASVSGPLSQKRLSEGIDSRSFVALIQHCASGAPFPSQTNKCDWRGRGTVLNERNE